MIFDFILNLFTSVVNFFASLLPTWSFPDGALSSVTGIVNNAYAYDHIIPVTQLVAVIAATILLFTTIFAWSGIKFIIHLIRGN